MRKILASALCCLALLAFSVPVYAENAGSEAPETETTSGTAAFSDDEVVNAAPAALADEESSRPPSILQPLQDDDVYPIDVRYEMLGNVPYITRVYELEGGEGASASVLPQTFAQDDYIFKQMEVLKKDIPGAVESKTASKNVVAECEKNDTAALLATLAPTVEYTQDGYSGTLQLDPASINFTEAGTESYSYRVTDTHEYPGLSTNDMAAVPKTVTKNGITLQLDGVEWQVTRTDPTDGGLVPTLYTAVAIYSGSSSGSRVSGYIATVNYTGEVSKTSPGKVQYTIVYKGTVKQATPKMEKKDETQKGGVPGIFFAILGVLVIGGLVSGGYILYRKRRRKTAGVTLDFADEPYSGHAGFEDGAQDNGVTGYPEDAEPDNIFPWEDGADE